MNALLGTRALVRLALRRDRVLLPIWTAVLVISAAGSAAATVGLYPASPTADSAKTTVSTIFDILPC